MSLSLVASMMVMMHAIGTQVYYKVARVQGSNVPTQTFRAQSTNDSII